MKPRQPGNWCQLRQNLKQGLKDEGESQRMLSLGGEFFYGFSVHRMILSMDSNLKTLQADIPSAPFFGGRRISLPLPVLFAHLNRPALFRIGWGAGKASGEKWARLQADFNGRLEHMQHALEQENWLAPAAVYGYWPCAATKDAIQIFPAADMPDTHILQMPVPRQPFPPFHSLCDFYLSMDGAQRDISTSSSLKTYRRRSRQIPASGSA